VSLLRRLLLSLLRILSGVPIVSLLGLGLLFLVFSVTWKGRCVGLGAVLMAGLLYCAVGYWNRSWFKLRRSRLFTVLIPTSLILFLVPAVLAPNGGNPDAPVRNCFLGGRNHFHRYSPLNIIPEVDQVSVGLHLVPFGDPYVNSAKARRMRSLTLPAYERMEQDPDFRELGSAMGAACGDLLHLGACNGHYYLFLPETSPDERIPCLAFLHGMGGNIKPHFWTLSQLSTRTKCAVVAPTFGMGLWQKEGSAEFVVDVTHEVIQDLPIDPDRVFLMGYSQGAVGVTRAAVHEPGLYRGLIYLSPITEDDLFGSPEFEAQNEGLRLLFLHGSNDLRIPCNFVEGTAKTLQRTGHDVEVEIYDGEDHYLILSQPEALLDDLAEFMTESGADTISAD
jgi:pimeloyl-ACP methyl ester carboxylesterase